MSLVKSLWKCCKTLATVCKSLFKLSLGLGILMLVPVGLILYIALGTDLPIASKQRD